MNRINIRSYSKEKFKIATFTNQISKNQTLERNEQSKFKNNLHKN